MLTRSNQALKVLISLKLSIYNQLLFKNICLKVSFLQVRNNYTDVFVDKILGRWEKHLSSFLYGSEKMYDMETFIIKFAGVLCLYAAV